MGQTVAAPVVHAGRERFDEGAVVDLSVVIVSWNTRELLGHCLAALERAGGGKASVVGDAVWDALSAEAADVPCIGLRSGGVAADRLRTAGASWVYDGPRDLLYHLGEALARARDARTRATP